MLFLFISVKQKMSQTEKQNLHFITLLDLFWEKIFNGLLNAYQKRTTSAFYQMLLSNAFSSRRGSSDEEEKDLTVSWTSAIIVQGTSLFI